MDLSFVEKNSDLLLTDPYEREKVKHMLLNEIARQPCLLSQIDERRQTLSQLEEQNRNLNLNCQNHKLDTRLKAM